MPFIDLNLPGTGVSGDAVISFEASCATTDQLGDVVYISADRIGSLYQVAKVVITNMNKLPGIGVIVQKLTSTTCVVMHSGEVTGLYSGLTPGKTLFVDSNSRLSESFPGSPTVGIVSVQPMAYSLASDTLVIKPEVPTIRVSG